MVPRQKRMLYAKKFNRMYYNNNGENSVTVASSGL